MSENVNKVGDSLGMAELLDTMDNVKPLRRGDIVKGIVMRADHEGILVNVGHKSEGLVPSNEMTTLSGDEIEHFSVGDSVIVAFLKNESGRSPAIFSIDKAVGERGWKTLVSLMEADGLTKGKLIGLNRGGAIVRVEGLEGFVPVSQLVSVSRSQISDNSQAEDSNIADNEVASVAGDHGSSDGESLNNLIDKGLQLWLKVMEVNRSRNRVILSERQAVQEIRAKSKAKVIQNLTENEDRRGTVTGITPFGAFVDIGGADGLIHISELSWGTVTKASDVVSVGDEVDVRVIKVDAENQKIALSLKRLQEEPWGTVGDRYKVGDIIDTTVTKIVDFGAFAKLEDSVEGLVHISELSSKQVNHVRDVVKEGNAIRLKIITIDQERRRIGLSLRLALEEEEK